MCAHTPSLGCSGQIAAGAVVWLAAAGKRRSSPIKPAVSSHTIYHVMRGAFVVGAHPQLANTLARAALDAGAVWPGLHDVRAEISLGNSRIDFVGTDAEMRRVVVEVKNVPVATSDGAAVFPDPANKPTTGTAVSMRAVKHAAELMRLVDEPNTVCILLFVSQRADVDRVVVGLCDPVYAAAVRAAADAGVQIKGLAVEWDPAAPQRAVMGRMLPVHITPVA